MMDLINTADYKDRKNTGIKKWARQCELHQQDMIRELEEKNKTKTI